MRIACTLETPNGAVVGSEQRRVLEEAAALCDSLGYIVEWTDPVIDGAAIVKTFRTISACNTLNGLRSHPSGRMPEADDVETVVRETARIAEAIDGATFLEAEQTAHRIGWQMAAFHDDYDLLLTPGLATLPPKLGHIDMMMDDLDEYWGAGFQFQSVYGLVQHYGAAGDDVASW